jgi:hypothetical protein
MNSTYYNTIQDLIAIMIDFMSNTSTIDSNHKLLDDLVHLFERLIDYIQDYEQSSTPFITGKMILTHIKYNFKQLTELYLQMEECHTNLLSNSDSSHIIACNLPQDLIFNKLIELYTHLDNFIKLCIECGYELKIENLTEQELEIYEHCILPAFHRDYNEIDLNEHIQNNMYGLCREVVRHLHDMESQSNYEANMTIKYGYLSIDILVGIINDVSMV